MSCREFVSLFLDAWVDGGLPERRARECGRHVAGCADCRAYAHGYRVTVVTARNTIGSGNDGVLPEALLRAIMAAAK
jgi:anti-sigma factor RsiW